MNSPIDDQNLQFDQSECWVLANIERNLYGSSTLGRKIANFMCMWSVWLLPHCPLFFLFSASSFKNFFSWHMKIANFFISLLNQLFWLFNSQSLRCCCMNFCKETKWKRFSLLIVTCTTIYFRQKRLSKLLGFFCEEDIFCFVRFQKFSWIYIPPKSSILQIF